jgi:undecaprenyl pyrophosphate phosphatase UppP
VRSSIPEAALLSLAKKPKSERAKWTCLHLNHSEYGRQSVRASKIGTQRRIATIFVVSFIVAYGCIAWFMAWVHRHRFVPFAIYRIVAGAALLIWLSRLGG